LATATLNTHELLNLLPGYDPYAQAGKCTFDEAAAIAAIEFVEDCCTHVKGELAGTPLYLEPWQKSVFANLFGWKRPDGSRRYRECLIYIPRKNSKTTMAAALVNLVMYTDGEPGAELYSAAAERDQARLCFEIVAGMIRNEPVLDNAAEIFKYSITVGSSSYKAVSAVANSKHGFNANLCVIDELHAHKSPELTEVLLTSMGSRRQPLAVHLTTADYDRPGICNDKHDYACKVRDGVIEDIAFLPVIYEADTKDDWTDREIWKKANPNFGVSFKEEYIERECKRALDSPAYENTFKRLHLNIKTGQATRLIPMHQWDACNGDVDVESLKGRKCWAGLDLSTIDDLCAFVLAFPGKDGDYDIIPHFWCHGKTARKRDMQGIPYLQWAREGLITLTEGDCIDYKFIRKKINEWGKEYSIQEIAFDPYNATDIVTNLGQDDGFEMVLFRQGFLTMGPPIKLTLRLLLNEKLRHGGHKVLRWNASNVAARMDHAENIMFDKDKSSDKIDGLVAMAMAVGRAEARPIHPGSIYNNEEARPEGVLWI
jgi:phage terminase large subunit-like protein